MNNYDFWRRRRIRIRTKWHTYLFAMWCIHEGRCTTLQLLVFFDASTKSSNGIASYWQSNGWTKTTEWYFSHSPPFQFKNLSCLWKQALLRCTDVQVSLPDTNLPQIVWRKQPTQSVWEYRLLMITYGTGNAAYLATKCQQQLAHDEDHPQQWSSGISFLVTYYKVPIKQMNPLYCNSNCVDYWTKTVYTKKVGLWMMLQFWEMFQSTLKETSGPLNSQRRVL